MPLFYKSAAACFACHDPPSGASRLGPELAKVESALTLEELVDSILRPSKRIDKEFAQVNVITVKGKQHTGIRVSENDDEIVLRNLAQPEPLTIQKDDIEEMIDSRTSLMSGLYAIPISSTFDSRTGFAKPFKMSVAFSTT